MTKINDIWQKKHGPLWLLLASRACAHYPTPDKLDNQSVNEYVAQFSQGIFSDIVDPDFINKLHPGHTAFFDILTKEAIEYYRVFYDPHQTPYDNYTGELIAQFNKAYGTEKSVMPLQYQVHENPQIIGNLVVAVAIAAIRDMALIESLHREGKFSEKEYLIALAEVNYRMNRTGINGVDRLLESKPELDDFLRHDIREINVGHIEGELPHTTKRRAACYNVGKTV